MNVGEVKSFAYTGGMQSYTITDSGVYKLEVYGAAGTRPSGTDTTGKESSAQGLGGYSVGYKLLTRGTVLYICCGGKGGATTTANGGGYNGGGKGADNGKPYRWGDRYGGHGGGATHMATVSGTLAAIGAGNKSKVLIVAGGGGGMSACGYYAYTKWGGNGGGSSGTKHSATSAVVGTQTGGAGWGQGQNATAKGSWADYEANFSSGGGGGGLYGGGAGTDYHHSGAGGSGYIGGVPSFEYKGVSYNASTTTGSTAATGNGSAKLTFVAKSTLPVTFNGTTLERIVFNGVEVESLIVNGVKLFMERMRRRMQAWNTSTRAGNPSSRPI